MPKGWVKMAGKVNYESTSDSIFPRSGKSDGLSGKRVTEPADVGLLNATIYHHGKDIVMHIFLF